MRWLYLLMPALLLACVRRPHARWVPICPTPVDSGTVLARPAITPALVGMLTNIDTRAPARGIVILQPSGRRRMTDSLGAFRFDSVPPGRHVLHLQALGFRRDSVAVDITTSTALELRIPLTPEYPDRCMELRHDTVRG